MDIKEITTSHAVVSLTTDELKMLHNVMYSYEQSSDASKISSKFDRLHAQIVMTKDICEYGHADDFALSHIVQRVMSAYNKENPGKDWLKDHLIRSCSATDSGTT